MWSDPYGRGHSTAQYRVGALARVGDDLAGDGVDLVVDYTTKVAQGQLNLTASANFTKTTVDAVNIPQTVADQFAAGDSEGVSELIFNREERNRLEDALPRQKGTLGATYRQGKLAARLRGNYYGSVNFKPNNSDNDETFGAKVILDSEVSYQLGSWRLAVGANNLLNTFPDKNELDANISNGRFVYSRRVSQYGINGGFYYLRLQFLK